MGTWPWAIHPQSSHSESRLEYQFAYGHLRRFRSRNQHLDAAVRVNIFARSVHVWLESLFN
jgi:hypothetical protein